MRRDHPLLDPRACWLLVTGTSCHRNRCSGRSPSLCPVQECAIPAFSETLAADSQLKVCTNLMHVASECQPLQTFTVEGVDNVNGAIPCRVDTEVASTSSFQCTDAATPTLCLNVEGSDTFPTCKAYSDRSTCPGIGTCRTAAAASNPFGSHPKGVAMDVSTGSWQEGMWNINGCAT